MILLCILWCAAILTAVLQGVGVLPEVSTHGVLLAEPFTAALIAAGIGAATNLASAAMQKSSQDAYNARLMDISNQFMRRSTSPSILRSAFTGETGADAQNLAKQKLEGADLLSPEQSAFVNAMKNRADQVYSLGMKQQDTGNQLSREGISSAVRGALSNARLSGVPANSLDFGALTQGIGEQARKDAAGNYAMGSDSLARSSSLLGNIADIIAVERRYVLRVVLKYF